ncbi:MAG: hypothetical protein AAF551_04000 [Bacteroidota bacterium]
MIFIGRQQSPEFNARALFCFYPTGIWVNLFFHSKMTHCLSFKKKAKEGAMATVIL